MEIEFRRQKIRAAFVVQHFLSTSTSQLFFSPISAAVFEVPQQLSKARQFKLFPFVTATDGASACGFVSVRVCACACECVIAASYGSKNQEHGQSQEQRCHSAFFAIFHFCSAVCCCCCCRCCCSVPVSHRKLLARWQPRYNGRFKVFVL